jgi:hypothetical protein
MFMEQKVYFYMKYFHLFRKFYAKQLEFIISIEAILVPKMDQETNETITNQQRQQRAVQILIIVNLIINIVCFPFFTALLH